jgi:hypothetical protein
MSVRRFFTTAAVLLCCAAPAAAQGIKLEFQDGRVNLSAQNAPLRTILNEWARLGGTKIVNGDRLAGGPVTLELNGVSERQALDILLRSASGYLAGPRQPGTVGQSAFATILILPTSSAPRAAAAPPPPPIFNANAARVTPVPQVVQPAPQDDPANDIPDAADDDRPVRPGVQRPRNPRDFVPPRVNGQPQPFEPDVDNDGPERREPAVAAPPANNPFGVPTGSSRPGVITPVPQQPQPRPQADPEP